MKGIHNADQLTQRHTTFESFEALINAGGGYCPSIQSESAGACLLPCGERITARNRRRELRRLADLYDEAQCKRGDHRRAWRSWTFSPRPHLLRWQSARSIQPSQHQEIKTP